MKLVKRNKFALTIGGTTFILVFLLNWQKNLFTTSFIRGFFAFIIFTTIGFILHVYLFGFINKVLNDKKGKHVNLEADKDEDLMNEIFNNGNTEESVFEEESQFKPLEVPEVERTSGNSENVEKVVNGVRAFTQDK